MEFFLLFTYFTATTPTHLLKEGQLTVQVLTLTFIGDQVCAVWYLDTLNTVTIAVLFTELISRALEFPGLPGGIWLVQQRGCWNAAVVETCFQQPRPADYGTGLSFPFVFFEYSYILHHMCSTESWSQGLSTSRGPWKGQNANQCSQIRCGRAWSGLHGNGV